MAEASTSKPEQQPKEAIATQQLIPSEAAKEVLEKRLEQLPAQELVGQFFAAISRTSIGPDPETARIMGQTEMHAESAKLEAYKKNLENRDKQSDRDHDYRCRKLQEDSRNLKIVLGAALVGCVGGVTLLVVGHPVVGSNLLLGSAATIYSIVGGRTPFTKDKE